MNAEHVPTVGIHNLETGETILLDPGAARMLATNILETALSNLNRPEALLAGSVLHGGSLTIQNEYGELLLGYAVDGRLLGRLFDGPGPPRRPREDS